jgi:hypothetical protein
MKFLIVSCFLCFSFFSFTQHEILNPIASFPSKKEVKTRSTCSIDSTFIYSSDTLSLPFLDEFSKNHFQKYEGDYLYPNVTQEKFYKLTDMAGVRLANNLRFTSQQTMRKIINTDELTVVDEIFPTQNIKVADFCFYPVAYTTTAVYPPYIIYDTINFVNDPDTIWLIDVDFFQDSAVQFFATLNDKNSYWLDSKAQHNYTNAVNPWTLGVVTFDGTNENGKPYLFNSFSNDYNDYLTSKPINLANNSPSDSLYFSFLYQSKGFNDEPEPNDSLILEFFAPQFNQWFHIWSISGAPLHDFKKVHIKITDTKFFRETFQFRFKNFGSPSGSLDQFHIDYVQLRPFSGYQDTLFKDFALVYPMTTILKDFTFVPWEHFKNNPTGKTTDKFKVTLRNASNVPENYQNGNLNISNNGSVEADINFFGQNLANGDNNYLANTLYASEHDISSFYDFNSSLDGDFQEFDLTFNATAQFTNLSVNDSVSFKQRFYDFYAYDDGTAEAAYGPNGAQARLAYKFTAYENDSLIGVKFRFVPSVNDVSNKLFLLTVWDDNNGKPGNEIYQDEFIFPRQPSYQFDDSLGFTNYYLANFQRLPINGTFYVGWRQIDQISLNVGFDWNNNQSDKIFYSVNNGVTWSNSLFEGSLLIRPIFSTNLNANLIVNEIKKEEKIFLIFPNPVQDRFYIKNNDLNYQGIELFDIQGKLIYVSSENEYEIDASNLNKGIYIIKDKASGITKKIVKN